MCSTKTALVFSLLFLTLWCSASVQSRQPQDDVGGGGGGGSSSSSSNNNNIEAPSRGPEVASNQPKATTTTTAVSPPTSPSGGWLAVLQVPKDEFNTTESPIQFLPIDLAEDAHRHLAGLRQVLLRLSFQDCCPSWANLSANTEIQAELARKSAKNAKSSLRAGDLLNELKRTFSNITYLSIDGQPGESEREKYYNFYDGVQYYLRLLRVARNYLDESTVEGSSTEAEFNRSFRRQVKSIEFKANRDPTLSSFLNEMLATREANTIDRNFEFYEDFLRRTQFGQHYARNISMIRDSVMVFDRICSHITSINFPSNLTRPSKLYEMIRRMSFELYYIRNELVQKVNPRIRNNRQDVRHVFSKLNDLTESRPYIRMLGDVFSSSPQNFGHHVKQLTHLLDLYTTNSLTEASFYKQLAELPEDFILLGSAIAHDYEVREVTHFNRFDSDSDNSNWTHLTYRYAGDEPNSTSSSTNDARRSNFSLLTRLFSSGG